MVGNSGNARRKDVDEILKKYGGKIEGKINSSSGNSGFARGNSSSYDSFKSELSPELSKYEKWCHSLGSLIRLNASEKDTKKIKKYLDIAHLNIEPWQALTLSVMTFLSVFLSGLLVSVAIMLVSGGQGLAGLLENFPFLFFILTTSVGIFLFYFMNGFPKRLANQWRLKASSQMVPAILYIVVYMRHTPNLEKAIAFASEHLDYPLSLDFKKIFYDVEVGKFSTIKESLDFYLERWRDYSSEFIEAFHLVESSLFEPDSGRRINTLEKSLQVVLDGVYDKMLNFTHEVKSPLTNVYMLGVVLPTLGLALLPLASAMLQGVLNWVHVLVLFNLIVPFVVFYLTDKILFLRPGGYGETALLEKNPSYHKFISKKPYFISALITLPFFILGFLPLIFQYTGLPSLLGLEKDYSFAELGIKFLGSDMFFNFLPNVQNSGVVGPFGIGALLLGMFIPLGAGVFFYTALKKKSKDLVKERNKTDSLEEEFNNSLFQLGNRIGNGVPPELAFGKVAESTKGLVTENFFRHVNYNIRQMGMSVEKAIFDENNGAIRSYPSQLISTSMRILVESSKKGLKIAATSLMSISEYVKNIHKITNRLKDMLAEIVSDMKSNMTFLAPLLSGVVVGLAGMITVILGKLDLPQVSGQSIAGVGSLSSLTNIFPMEMMIPPYFLQLSIGLYIIEITFILSSTLVAINSGQDKLKKTYETSLNLKKATIFYFLTAFCATLALSVLASVVLSGMA